MAKGCFQEARVTLPFWTNSLAVRTVTPPASSMSSSSVNVGKGRLDAIWQGGAGVFGDTTQLWAKLGKTNAPLRERRPVSEPRGAS